MNFLPLVLIFLMIFSAVSLSFMHSQFLDKGEKEGLLGSIQAMRKAYNHCEDMHYKRRIGKHKAEKPSSDFQNTKKEGVEEEEELEEEYFRIQWMNSPAGAIDLAHLIFCSDKDYELLLDITTRYLKKIYEKASFNQTLNDPNWIRSFLLFMINEQKSSYHKNKTFLPLTDLNPQTEVKKFFHKLIRGTKTWELLEQRGYPPLDYCICFRNRHTKPIFFSIINPILLEVLFGKAQARKICELEMEKKKRIKKNRENKKKSHLNNDELREILEIRGNVALLNLFSFERPRAKNLLNKTVDHKSKISEQVQSYELIKSH